MTPYKYEVIVLLSCRSVKQHSSLQAIWNPMKDQGQTHNSMFTWCWFPMLLHCFQCCCTPAGTYSLLCCIFFLNFHQHNKVLVCDRLMKLTPAWASKTPAWPSKTNLSPEIIMPNPQLVLGAYKLVYRLAQDNFRDMGTHFMSVRSIWDEQYLFVENLISHLILVQFWPASPIKNRWNILGPNLQASQLHNVMRLSFTAPLYNICSYKKVLQPQKLVWQVV